MKERQLIEQKLMQTARRRRWHRTWTGLWRGFFWGATAWLLTLIIYKLLPIPFESLGWAGGVWAITCLGGGIWQWLQRGSLKQTAQWVDDQCGLKERISSVLEFDHKEHWGSFILRDARTYLDKIQPRTLVAFQLPTIAKWSVLVLALSAGLGFVPEYRTQSYLEEQREQAVMESTGKHLVEFIKQEIEKRPPALQPTEEAMAKVEELGTQLSKAKLNRENALKDIASLTEKLKDQYQALDQNPALDRMRKMARTPTGNAAPESMNAMQKRMERLQQELGEKLGEQAAMQELQRKLDQLKQAASGLQTPDGGMNESLKQSLSEQLEDLAQQAPQMGLSSSELDAALASLKGGDYKNFLKDLDQAQINLEKMLQMAQELQKLQSQMSEIGKDLAEQLEKGQASIARQNLLEKASDLMSGKPLSKEELERMLKELEKALPEAADYGKVQELLKSASQKLSKGDKQGGAQDMMAAADELKKLMDQFGDQQSLMASLDGLLKAGMCVGTCQGWGQCKNPGFKPGGKPGSGVGTWGEEGGDFVYRRPSDQSMDNSDVKRPDMEARGHTDRGEAQLADGLTPTQVKGQFSPGSPMPSITLKGISIKGQSQVEYTETVAAAQVNAESALSQQRVPRAYQHAVRDYFDDLKE